ncbi:DUF945 family protein [Orrella sp. 11846]|uniref:DUF945 family protein n=1 Tax=Orrella sp. 11846 TaxID=3409913 RepID=UPI003B5B8FEF
MTQSSEPETIASKDLSPETFQTKPRRRKKRSPMGWVVGTVVVLGLAYGAGSYFVGERAQSHLNAIVEQKAPDFSGFQIREQSHDQGIWQSSGYYVLSMSPVDATPVASDLIFRIDYTLDHALWPGRLANIKTQLIQADQTRLTGQGVLSWEGVFNADLAMPAQELIQEGTIVRLAALQGKLKGNAQGVTTQVHWPSIEYIRNQKIESQLKEVTIETDWVPGQCIGQRYVVKSQLVMLSVGQIEGFAVSATPVCASGQSGQHVLGSGERVGLDLEMQAVGLHSNFWSAQDVRGKMTWRHLDAQAFGPLLMGSVAGLIAPTETKPDWWQPAMRDLMLKGLDGDAVITQAKTGLGDIQAQATLNLMQMPDALYQSTDLLPFDQYLVTEGQVRLTNLKAGSLLALVSGLFETTRDGIGLRYELTPETFTVNGQSLPDGILRKSVNDMVNQWLGIQTTP